MKAKVLMHMNALLALLMSVLGFAGCDPGVEKYGVPYTELDVFGTITDEDNKPLENIQVQVKYISEYGYTPSPVYSDSIGQYAFTSRDSGEQLDSIDVLVKDTSGVYECDTMRVPTEYHKVEDSGWKVGESVAHHDFRLKKK